MFKIEKTFIKNYGYGSFIGILSYNQIKEPRKSGLDYFEVLANGTLIQITKHSKETKDLEKLARKFINTQDYFILYTY